ncbi:MAG: polysaccharide biosynthesis protein [Pseudomonadales bacterium]|nr:polysaccharide biosynthesis protein [Pseudomonadales bacterium]
MLEQIVSLPRNLKRVIALAADLLLLPMTLWLAFCLRLDELYTPDLRVATTLGLTTLLTILVLVRLGLYRAVIRFAGVQLLSTSFIGVSLSVLSFAFIGFILNADIPRSVPLIYMGLGLLAVCGSRFFVKALLTVDSHKGNERVIVYGAGSGGVQVATALKQGVEYEPVAFIDDDKSKVGSILEGLRVYKARHISRLMARYKANTVLLAIGTLSNRRRSEIIEFLEQFDVRIRTIPGFADIVSGEASIDDVRDVQVEDLLGRDTVPADQGLLDQCILGKIVMVTGAGGSIGSELCRQVIALKPAKLLLLELSEYALYAINEELSSLGSEVEVSAFLANVQDKDYLLRIMQAYQVDTIYHAAAYKHVPLVEHNLVMGIRNNVFGTRAAALAAVDAKVKNFILVSTDKAVRPTNVMGASKRMAELVLQDLAASQQQTVFSMVRFGNVLGSSGSVVPLFKQQIRAGGPVTVTHPEMTRYFMTIPEAVQLVIQASALGEGGDVFLLDMGEPVQIARLAQSMIKLMGYSIQSETHPAGEIAVSYTGLRPGEKLYEELLIGDNCIGTKHPMITRAMEIKLTAAELSGYLNGLLQACEQVDLAALIKILCSAVNGYVPTQQIHDNLIHAGAGADVIDASAIDPKAKANNNIETNVVPMPGVESGI